MFKLVKILNSGVNVPEPVKVQYVGSRIIKSGCIYYWNQGTISCDKIADNDDLIYVLQNANKGGEKTYVCCYVIKPNMIFEVDVYDKPSIIYAGEPFTLKLNNEKGAYTIKTEILDDDDEVAYGKIIDIINYESTGKVLIRFD